jgi:hypothetical protein
VRRLLGTPIASRRRLLHDDSELPDHPAPLLCVERCGNLIQTEALLDVREQLALFNKLQIDTHRKKRKTAQVSRRRHTA